ncbi:MAG: sulfatase-like hydrolase/transferase, partial [Verrucomicrobiota bacterium]
QPDAITAEKTIELLRKKKADGEKFLIAAGFIRPHYPMIAPEEYFTPYPFAKMPLPHVPSDDLEDIPKLGQPSIMNGNNPIGKYPDNQKRMWSAYYAATQFMDDQVGKILDELDRLGLRETTAIVFTSDHGYHLGEHTFWQKSNLHEESVRVPLIVHIPGMEPGRTKSFAELVDLYPTMAEAVGIAIPDAVQGKSLLPVVKDPSVTIRDSAVSFHKGTGLRTADWAYMKYQDGSEELYDMIADPHQYTNLASSPDHQTTLKKHRNLLSQREPTFIDAAAKTEKKAK